MRMRKKKHTDERLEACSQLLITQPETHKGNYRGLFGEGNENKPLHLEIGCGKGAFILELAREGLGNVLFLNADAAKLAEYFAPGEIDRIYLNFSDPWPKSRHAKRRLTAPGFLAVYREILKEGGYIRQKTDNVLLFESSLESYAECGWRCEDICRDLHNSPWAEENILTEYEINFSGKGLTINAVTAYRD